MNVLFLDIDGVVNTCMWGKDPNGAVVRPRYSSPSDLFVNNWQACQWLSEFCTTYDYKIVVSSTWSQSGLEICRACLYAGGVWPQVEIIDALPYPLGSISNAIKKWLHDKTMSGNVIRRWIIVDDDPTRFKVPIQRARLVECRSDAGFLLGDLKAAEEIHKSQDKTSRFLHRL